MRQLLKSPFRRLFSTVGCSAVRDFRVLMQETLQKNYTAIENLLPSRGINYSLYMLSSLSDQEMSSNMRKLLVANLVNSDQKITKENYNLLCERLPEETDLHKIYGNPERQFTSETTFQIGNTTITTVLIANSLNPNINYEAFDRLTVERTSHIFTDDTEEEQRTLMTRFTGKNLNSLMRAVIAEEQLFFDGKLNEFFLKYNDKLIKHYPPNVLFRYCMESKKYPLQVDLLDLPVPFIMEELCERKSLAQMEDTLAAANIFNLVSKFKETMHPELDCPKCSDTKKTPSIADGYCTVLSQDHDLHSLNKVNYMLSELDNLVKKTPKGNILVILTSDYAPFMRDALKAYSNRGELGFQPLTLEMIRKDILKRTTMLEKGDLTIPMKKSIVSEFLFETNTVNSYDYFKSLGQDVEEEYVKLVQDYDGKLSLDTLDPAAAAKLVSLFKREQCELLQLIFGNEEELIETAYEEETVKRIFNRLDEQTNQKGDSGKIKITKPL